MRSVAVVIEEVVCEPQVQRPMGVAAASGLGALGGFGTGFAVAADWAGPIARRGNDECTAFLATVVFVGTAAVAVPVCTIGGCFIGGSKAMPSDEVEWRIAAVKRALLAGSPALGLGVSLPVAVHAARPSLRRASRETADAVITVRPVSLGLLGRSGLDPRVAVVVEFEVTWTAGEVMHSQRWQYRGPERPLTEWSGQSSRIAEELRLARKELSTRIAEELLLVEVVR